jgi:hypothetical protein
MFEELSDEWQEWIALTRWNAGTKARSSSLNTSRKEAALIPTPILTVLSTFRKNGVQTLLMGGQACVFYGAAQVSRLRFEEARKKRA